MSDIRGLFRMDRDAANPPRHNLLGVSLGKYNEVTMTYDDGHTIKFFGGDLRYALEGN